MEDATVLLAEFSEYLQKHGKGLNTVESYSRDARFFLDFVRVSRVPLAAVEPETLKSYRDHLVHDKNGRENSVRRKIIGVRVFFRFLTEKLGHKESSLDASPIPPRREIEPRKLTDVNIASLLSAAKKGGSEIKSARDAAIVGLLAWEGIKATELTNLNWSDHLPGSLRIQSQRGRVLPILDETSRLLNAYKQTLVPVLRLLPGLGRRMFIGFKGREVLTPHAELTRHGLKFLLYELGEACQLSMLNTEDLRHYAIRFLVNRGFLPEEVMQRLGLRQLAQVTQTLRFAEGNPRVAL